MRGVGTPRVYGPYAYSSDGGARLLVHLVYEDGVRHCQSYARFLLEEALGRQLQDFEDADHIDGDPLNNEITNLRVLRRELNRTRNRAPAEWFEFLCPSCGGTARRLARRVRDAWSQGKAGPYCSRSCAAKGSRPGHTTSTMAPWT